MIGSNRTTAQCRRALAALIALVLGSCLPLRADDAIEFGQRPAEYSARASAVGHAQWSESQSYLREVFSPAAGDELSTPSWAEPAAPPAASAPSPSAPPLTAPVTAAPSSGISSGPASFWAESAAPEEAAGSSIFSPLSPRLLDGLTLFGGLEGSKQPQDLGVNGNLGGRLAANWGRSLVEQWHLGVQVGVGYNFSDNAQQVFNRQGINDGQNQLYTTIGLFQRTDWGFNWSFAHDALYEGYYDYFSLSQWRGRAGYQVTDNDEFGVWGTIADSGDSGPLLGTTVHLRSISQANFFWRHAWTNGGWITGWLGSAQEHGTFVLGLAPTAPVKNAFVYGGDLQLPLNDWWAIYGEANFITPASSGTIDAYVGFVFYPGGGVRQALRKRYAPLMQTASNASFAVDMR